MMVLGEANEMGCRPTKDVLAPQKMKGWRIMYIITQSVYDPAAEKKLHSVICGTFDKRVEAENMLMRLALVECGYGELPVISELSTPAPIKQALVSHADGSVVLLAMFVG